LQKRVTCSVFPGWEKLFMCWVEARADYFFRIYSADKVWCLFSWWSYISCSASIIWSGIYNLYLCTSIISS